MRTSKNDGAAKAPGLVTPTSDNAPWQARVGGIEGLESPDFASTSALRKRLATARARAALGGITVFEQVDEHGARAYVAAQSVWSREFSAIEDLESWLGRVAGRTRP